MSYKLLLGDCIETLRTLPDACVQTCVTSPPYYGLRDYGTATWEGGSEGCDHRVNSDNAKSAATSTLGGSKRNVGNALTGYGDICGKCGAHRIDSQIGLEGTPDAYVAKLVDVFREVRRVLRDDGTLWLNLGDSYNGSNGNGNVPQTNAGLSGSAFTKYQNVTGRISGLKPKDLIGIPWLVAFALRADGWWLRSDIIWHKPNPMPESVTDRPTKAHEYIFLLSKSQTYFYDADAVRESLSESTANDPRMNDMGRTYTGKGRGAYGETGKANGQMQSWSLNTNGRNRRSVWTVATKPYAGAHFATYPVKLIEPCILAGSKRGDTVLDPFNGSGTTGAVALKHGREYIGIDLNPEYIELSHRRITQSQPTLLEVTE